MKFDDSIPLYLQIKREIENAIITGSVKEDKPIPSIRNLAQEYRVNPQTISNAVGELMQEGILYKKRGIGMFVQPGAREILREKKCKIFREDEFPEIIRKGKTLGIKMGELINIIKNEYKKEV